MVRRYWVSLVALVAVVFMLAAPGRTARADGLIVIHNPPVTVPGHFSFAPLEVTYHKVDCTIKDQVAVTSVDQEFYNPNNARLEGDYIFPVPLNAQINEFAMDIDGKMITAELLPADKARKIYEDIVRAAKDPALLEYAGRAMYKVRIFPIEPNSRKRIQLKYTELLKQDGGLADYHYTLNTEKFSSKPLKNVSIKVTIDTTEPITSLYSPTHEVEIKRHGETSAVVGFEAKDIRPDTDFHLYIGHKTSPVGITMLTYRPDPDKDGYFVLLAAPTVSKATKAMPKDVVFVMDTSGSMSGPKIEQTKKALKFCIETLNATDRFEIVRFSTEAEPFFSSLQVATDANRKKAVEFTEAMRASGGTAIQDALNKALEERPAKDDGRLFMIVFMTDGQPTVGEQNPDRILATVKEKSGTSPVRIFSFGVGSDVNTKLLDLASEQTRGYAQYVLPNENLEVAMSSFWSKVQDPVIAGLKLETGAMGVSKLYPKDLPDLFRGDQLVVFGTYSKAGNSAVTLTGMINGKQEKFAQDVTFEAKTDSDKDWIARLWASRRVGYLLDEIRLHGESKELKDEITELARRWGIVTPYTAMLIIEDERRRAVPVAVQSLREMGRDAVAAGNSGRGYEAMKSGSTISGGFSGTNAVAGAINNSGLKMADNIGGMNAVAAQDKARSHFEGSVVGASGSAMAKGDSPALAPTSAPMVTNGAITLSGSGTFTGNVTTVGGATYSGGTMVNMGTGQQVGGERGKELNLGTYNVNGWQNGRAGENNVGYRVVNNYAQQSRVVNNRSFYLNGNQWTDARAQKAELEKAAHVKVVFNSDAYFELLKKFPDAPQYLSLGNNVTVELGGTIYDIVDEPAKVETK